MDRRRSLVLRALALAMLLGATSACARRATPNSEGLKIETASPATSPNAPAERVTRLGESIESRPIDLHVFGDGPRPVLVIGGIHGSEPTSAFVAERLVEHLRHDPAVWQAPGAPAVAVIPVANPDGCRWGVRTNARRVDVNRNFPAANWRRRAHAANNNGDEPLSEPESRAIAHAVDTLSPRLIVSIHSIGHGRQCNNFDGPAAAVAEAMSRHNGYPVQPSMGYPTPGSLGSWAGIDRQIPVVTLELPRQLPGEQAWIDNRDALLAAIAWADDDEAASGR